MEKEPASPKKNTHKHTVGELLVLEDVGISIDQIRTLMGTGRDLGTLTIAGSSKGTSTTFNLSSSSSSKIICCMLSVMYVGSKSSSSRLGVSPSSTCRAAPVA
jgi:hypothetical protein